MLALVTEVALELYPRRKRHLRVTLDSSLDTDLGFDSLGRTELHLRLERAFKITLPEDLFAQGETPRDLLAAVVGVESRAGAVAETARRRPPFQPASAAPSEAGTLTEILDWHARTHPERPHVVLPGRNGEHRIITYGALAEDARAVARGLRLRGLEPGERVAIMLPTGEEFFSAFFGVLYAGGVPVPLSPPMRLPQIEDHLRRQVSILRNAGAEIVITIPQARPVTVLLRSQVDSVRSLETVDTLRTSRGDDDFGSARAEDTALLQYTSGSTGDPIGVVLSHANLLANIRAMGQAINADSSDVFVSWLPLYHDLGLIGAWLGSLDLAIPTVIMSPLDFLVRPERWFWAIHEYGGTLSLAPNFAYELCLHRIADQDLEGLDLSSLRMTMNGAEPVSAATVRRFTERFARFGFRPEAMAPVYGLAESTVGLAFPPPGRLPIIDRVQRRSLIEDGKAVPVEKEDDPSAMEIVACGQPLPGHEIRIVDGTGNEVGERREGRLQFRGPSSTSGYHDNPAKTRELFDDDWLETGDLAYIAAGDVFVTGRARDIIIRAGRNIYPQQVEEAIGGIVGIRKGCVAVFGSLDPRLGTERIVVLAETRMEAEKDRSRLQRRIVEVTTELLDAPPDDVVVSAPHTVPKTSSGKVRRAASRALYESGQLGRKPRAPWWQLARFTALGLRQRVRDRRRAAFEVLFAGYWWALIGIVAPITWLGVLLMPLPNWRWPFLRAAARLAFTLTGMRPAVEGLRHLPSEGCILAANHTSYLDGLVLAAALPGELAFVVEREPAERSPASLFLRRIGAIVVEPSDPEQGIEDTRKPLTAAREGRRLVFFPEGAATRRPGLTAFGLGAFAVASQADVPVIPVTIVGARSVLRPGQWLPRRGSLGVRLAPAVLAEGSDWAVAMRLRDAVREEILERCGEPDLVRESVRF